MAQSGTTPSPSASEWINGIWNRHTTEYYSATKRNDALQHGSASVTLPRDKEKSCSKDHISHEKFPDDKSIETGRRLVVAFD